MQASKQPHLSSQSSIIFLPINKTQRYGWGCTDKKCLVGLMSEENLNNYAQFWMGTHPNGYSKLSPELSLKDYLEHNYIQQLQFLFKILSIEKCLSIQVHPNDLEAKQLNKRFPQIYVDNKDKPQMLLTLSDEFELFLGFISEKEMEDLLKIEPFKSISVQMPVKAFKERIIWMVQQLVIQNQCQLKDNIETLFKNLDQLTSKRQSILKRLFNEFGYDAGILVCCLLQYHKIPKESCFGIEPGIPHAYIKGQCFELMNSSDNVVRLGLTPKQKDVPNLIKIIKNNIEKTYIQVQPISQNSIQKFQWKSYSINKLFLKNQYQKVSITSNSIGIALNGTGFMRSFQSQNSQLECKNKSVFFLKKGCYEFKGIGQVFIASKA